MNAPRLAHRLDSVRRPDRRGHRLGLGLVVLLFAGCAAAPQPVPTPLPEVKLVPVFIDDLARCAFPCAPMPIEFACRAPGRLKCKCADGTTVDVTQPEPPKPDGLNWPRWDPPPILRPLGPPHLRRARA